MKPKHPSATTPEKTRPARRRRARKADPPLRKRSVICPPDRTGRHPLFRLGGLACRAFVIWLAASGLVIFLSDAIQSGVPIGAILATSLVVVVLGMLFAHSAAGKLIASLVSVGGVGTLVFLRPALIHDLPYSFLSLYNAILNRLNRLGYWSYAKFRVDLPSLTDTSEDWLALEAVCIVTVLLSILFVACFARKVHLVPPAILTTSFITVVLTFNIYTNGIKSNVGIVLIIVSFASVLFMGAYDRLYRHTDTRNDDEMPLFEDAERPAMPGEYLNSRAARDAKRHSRASVRRARRNRTLTVEEELNDYFTTGKTHRSVGKSSDDRRTRRMLRREIRAVKKYDRTTEEAQTAMGGYAAAAVMLACLIAIGLPALYIKGNFSTIPAIDDKLELARNYVTAVLRGDEKALDRLDYETDQNNFASHSTTAEHLSFDGRQIFFVQTRYNTNFYLRGWIGQGYADGAWLAVDDATLNRYHQTFGEGANPAESMKYDFYSYMKPDLVRAAGKYADRVYPDYYLDHFGAHSSYGFVGTLVNIRRVNSPSSLAYFPISYDPNVGLLQFGTVEPNNLSFVNYYDGIYTGRAFDQNKLEYAALAYVPVMTDPNWISRLSHLQASYSLQREAMLATAGMATGDNRLSLIVIDRGETVEFRYTLKASRRSDPDTIWSTHHAATSFERTIDAAGRDVFTVTTEDGILSVIAHDEKVVLATVTNPSGQNLIEESAYTMSDAERTALLDSLKLDRDYTAFVYDTYTGRSDSSAIRKLASTIRDQAHTEVRENGQYRDIPADVSLAAIRNTSIADAYVQRDRLVRNVIDYIITELACRYTITPNKDAVDPAMDGVENFLFNTKEGYCVQYASSVALILRELGIPTRYADGYIASGLTKAPKDFSYSGHVHDNNAHAWVEVWFDGVGWIPYETTPEYYIGIYGLSSAIDVTVTRPGMSDETESGFASETEFESGADTETESESETESVVETESETEFESETESETIPLPGTYNTRYLLLIGGGVLLLLALVALVFRILAIRAEKAEKQRRLLMEQAMEGHLSETKSPEERRAVATSVVDAVTQLLACMDLSPAVGEFREEYAHRLTEALRESAEEDEAGKKPSNRVNADISFLPDIHRALSGMAAEEFGRGMSDAELRELALLYNNLHARIKRRIPRGKRFRLRYFQRKI